MQQFFVLLDTRQICLEDNHNGRCGLCTGKQEILGQDSAHKIGNSNHTRASHDQIK